jgi:hypothetical protein
MLGWCGPLRTWTADSHAGGPGAVRSGVRCLLSGARDDSSPAQLQEVLMRGRPEPEFPVRGVPGGWRGPWEDDDPPDLLAQRRRSDRWIEAIAQAPAPPSAGKPVPTPQHPDVPGTPR